MKRTIAVLVAGVLLLLGSNAASADADEEGWEVYRKARPKLALKSAAVARVLSPFGQVPELPIEPAPNVLREQVTITLSADSLAGVAARWGWYNNLYIKSTDIVLITGIGQQNFIALTGENNVIEPGAIILYDEWVLGDGFGDRRLDFAVINGSLRVGALGGEVVNFSGDRNILYDNGWYDGGGSRALANNGNTELHEVVFVNHLESLGTAARDWDTSLQGESVYFINCAKGLTVVKGGGGVSGTGKARVRLENLYFAKSPGSTSVYVNRPEQLFAPEYVSRFSCELGNVFFGPGQSPLAEWDTSEFREGYIQVFKISEPNPTTRIEQVEETQTWPRKVLFAREDFDRNGSAGITDLVILSRSFGNSTSADLFGFRYDLNGDNVVNLPDVAELAYAFAGISRTEPIAVLSASPAMPDFLATLIQYPAIREASKAEALVDPNGFGAMVQSYIQRTAVAEVSGETPVAFSLEQNYPNPFNSGTVIRFSLPVEARTVLTVYNVNGQVVARLVDETLTAGSYIQMWDGLGADGHSVASGTYIYRLAAGAFTETRQMSLLR